VGGSAGAQLALLVALTHDRPEFVEQVGVPGDDLPVAAVVDFFGPADALTMQDDDITGGRNDHERPDAPISRLVGGPPRENPDLARACSPISYVRSDAPPVLAFHGTADDAVGPKQSRRLVAALRDAGADAELIEVPGAGHGFIGIDIDPVLDRSVAFLKEHLT
jgi:dipeptidyl aminopeptidase/acylaminoacyl peptidase